MQSLVFGSARADGMDPAVKALEVLDIKTNFMQMPSSKCGAREVLRNRRKQEKGASENEHTVSSMRPGTIGGRQVLSGLRGKDTAGENHLSLLREGDSPRPALSALWI